MKENYLNGISWGDVKQELFLVMNKFLEQPREFYFEFMGSLKRLDEILLNGAEKARKVSVPFLKEIKKKVGLSE
jgi:tryptophanyl-tRNA synthetase